MWLVYSCSVNVTYDVPHDVTLQLCTMIGSHHEGIWDWVLWDFDYHFIYAVSCAHLSVLALSHCTRNITRQCQSYKPTENQLVTTVQTGLTSKKTRMSLIRDNQRKGGPLRFPHLLSPSLLLISSSFPILPTDIKRGSINRIGIKRKILCENIIFIFANTW